MLAKCVLKMCPFTGWYNNKVAGLLGTMDNEPTTDLIRPNRVVDLDLTSLARSWDVSSKKDCKTVDNFARKSVPSDDGLTEICASFFQSQRFAYNAKSIKYYFPLLFNPLYI